MYSENKEKIENGNEKKETTIFLLENCRFFIGGEQGIRTLGIAFTIHLISNQAPSTARTTLHDLFIIHNGEWFCQVFY